MILVYLTIHVYICKLYLLIRICLLRCVSVCTCTRNIGIDILIVFTMALDVIMGLPFVENTHLQRGVSNVRVSIYLVQYVSVCVQSVSS